MSLYPWFPIPATVHKVLIHGYQIIEASILPLGVLSERLATNTTRVIGGYMLERVHGRTT